MNPPDPLLIRLERLGQTWRLQPTEANTEAILNALSPAIAGLVGRFDGLTDGAIERADLEQEARLAALNALYRWEPERGKLYTWLYGSALNGLRNLVKAQKRACRSANRSVLRIEDITLPEASYEEVALKSPEICIRRRALLDTLEFLSERERLALLLHADGHSLVAIGRALRISSHSTKRLLVRVTAQTRTRLRQLGIDESDL